MKSKSTRTRLAKLALAVVCTTVGMLGLWLTEANAQCTTCATTTVAYMPVSYAVYQPVVAQQPDTGWYLGRWFDRRRAKRQAAANSQAAAIAVAPTTYTAGYATAYTTNYVPYTANYVPYTAAYAPAPTVTYKPYLTAYAPLAQTVVARPVVQAAYSPVVSSGCQSCVAVPTATMRPVIASGCSTCSVTTPVAGCSTCSTGVSPAIYTESASSCAGCASSSAGPIYSGGAVGAGSVSAGPQTPQPQLAPQPTSPIDSTYKTNRPPAPVTTPTPQTAPAQTPAPGTGSGIPAAANGTAPVSPVPQTGGTAVPPVPAPQPEAAGTDTNTYLGPPQLLNPADRSARRLPAYRSQVSVDVHSAVYQKQASSTTASSQFTTWQTANPQRSQAEIDAQGWQSVRH